MSKLKIFLFATLLAITSFTHLYRIDKTFTFQGDEARDILIAKKMIDTKRPILLGPETSVGNMYLGPLYYYFITPALMASQMHPMGPAILVGIFGILTTLLIFLWGSKKFGLFGGFIAGMFYALSPVMLHYSRSSWNPNIVPFFAVLLLYVMDLKPRLSWILLGICAGALFQLHYVALVAIFITAMLLLYRDYKVISIKEFVSHIALAIAAFIVVSGPFWLFEMRHDFVDTRAFFTYISNKSSITSDGPGYLQRFSNNISLITNGIVGSQSISLTKVPTWIYYSSSIFLFLFPIFFVNNKKFINSKNILWLYLVGTLIIVSLLKETMNIHYISHIFPIIALMFGALVSSSKIIIKIISFIFVLAIFIWSYNTLSYNLIEKSSIQVERAQTIADYIVSQAAGRPYNVVNAQGSSTTTIQYYLSLSDNPPKNTLQDLIFDVCEQGPCSIDDETSVLLFLTGPTHPSIAEYLGHPQINEFSQKRKIIDNVRISYDTYVATIILIKDAP